MEPSQTILLLLKLYDGHGSPNKVFPDATSKVFRKHDDKVEMASVRPEEVLQGKTIIGCRVAVSTHYRNKDRTHFQDNAQY